MHGAAVDHVTVSRYAEEAIWSALRKQAIKKGAKLLVRLRHANAILDELIAEAFGIRIASGGPADVHVTESRQQRRNRISEKCEAAFDEIYELSQSERLAKENQTRAVFYAVLSRLAQVNEIILQGAAEEEILVEMQKLREDQDRFEKATEQLEEEARESSTKE
jgi:SepF-like predicted cell division protein (DUF552 family)